MVVLERAQGELAYWRALRRKDQLETRDIHDAEEALAEALGKKDQPTNLLTISREGTDVPHGGKVLRTIRGMGTVYDWRSSPWTPVNGGKFRPLIFVHHIPVIPQMAGIADFIRLRDVLVAQRLMVQTATDGSGNVALYTPFNSLCFHARGANQVSTGCEHMHFSINDAWSKKQLRAAAWLNVRAKRKFGIPSISEARLGSGNGVVRVLSKGQSTHEAVSDKAGFKDRSDPGPRYDKDYVDHCVHFFNRHGHFEGA